MSILTKLVLAPRPGTEAIPAFPGYFVGGTPPVSPHPAYCVDETVSAPAYRYVMLIDPETGELYIAAISGGSGSTTVHKCYPASEGSPGVPGQWVEGTPGVPPTPPTTADFQIGWTGSARSIDSLVGDGMYQFVVDRNAVGVVTGFNDADGGSNYLDIDHAIYCASGTYKIIEQGTLVGVTGSYDSDDEFTIARVGTGIAYYKNSTLLYSSALASSGEIFADASMYMGGDQILDASLTGTVAAGFAGVTGSLTGLLGGMRAYISDSAGAFTPPGLPYDPTDPTNSVDPATGDWPGRSADQLRMLTASFTSDPSLFGDMVGVLDGMTCFMVDDTVLGEIYELRGVLPGLVPALVAEGGLTMLLGVMPSMEGEMVASDVEATMSGRLDGMSCYFEVGLLMPDYALLPLTFDTMVSFVVALAGMSAQLTGVLGGMRGFASNAPNAGYMQAGLPVDSSTVIDPITGDWNERSGDQLRMMTGLILDKETFEATSVYSRSGMRGVLPMLQVDAHISTGGIARVNAFLPSLQAAGWFGIQVDATLPMLTVDTGGQWGTTLRADILLPMLYVEAGGTSGTILGTPEGYPLMLPMLTVSASALGPGEGAGQVVLPMLTVDAHAYTELHLTADIRLPRLRASGLILNPSALQIALGAILSGHVVLPHLEGQKTAQASILLPSLLATGYIAIPTSGLDIGYAMNLKHSAVTEFSHFPFLAMARAFNRYWGVGRNGKLYRFGGDLDDTAKIDWEWRSGMADFGLWGQKAAFAVYIRGIFENGATVIFVSDDEAVREYEHVAAGDYRNFKVHRVLMGKGVRTDSMAMGMRNIDGGYLELTKMTPEYRIIPRNL